MHPCVYCKTLGCWICLYLICTFVSRVLIPTSKFTILTFTVHLFTVRDPSLLACIE